MKRILCLDVPVDWKQYAFIKNVFYLETTLSHKNITKKVEESLKMKLESGDCNGAVSEGATCM